MFNSQTELTVKYDFFRNVYDHEFHISFCSPATDCCSFCIQYVHRIQTTKDLDEKSELSTALNFWVQHLIISLSPQNES